MRSRLQLDMRNLSLGRRHLVNAYEVEAGIGVIAGNTVWSMPRLECEVLQKARYINTLTFTFTFTCYLCHGGDYAVNVVCLSVYMSVILFVCSIILDSWTAHRPES